VGTEGARERGDERRGMNEAREAEVECRLEIFPLFLSHLSLGNEGSERGGGGGGDGVFWFFPFFLNVGLLLKSLEYGGGDEDGARDPNPFNHRPNPIVTQR